MTPADFELKMEELRAVARYAAQSAQVDRHLFEEVAAATLGPGAAACLHPLANATQVGHILRAAAGAARATELRQVTGLMSERHCSNRRPTAPPPW